MSLSQLPVVVIHHPEPEYKHQQICTTITHNFLDISTILSTPPSNKSTRFYWLIFTSNELITCLKSYTKAVPIGYKLFLNYCASSDIKSSKSKFISLTHIQQSIFDNLFICTSGIHNEIKSNIKLIAQNLGGIYDGNFTDSTTHLIENTIGSAKHKAAVNKSNCFIVREEWIYDCYINGCIMNIQQYCPLIFNNYFISVTGIKSVEREQIKIFIEQYGGKYCQGLSEECTHLITNDLNQMNKNKCQAAIEWNIPILKKEWFYDYLKYKGCVDINKYKYIPQMDIEHEEKELNDGNSEIDIGEDTELRDLMEMIDNHNDSQLDANNNNIKIKIDWNKQHLCYLNQCVVLILGLNNELIKEAIDLVRIAKGTTLQMYHCMGTHVITSDINIIKNKYNKCLDHCVIVNMDWLRYCYKNKTIISTNKFNLLLIKNNKNNNSNNNRMDIDEEFSSQASITTAITHYNNAINNNQQYSENESKQYSDFVNQCLDLNMNEIKNKQIFLNCKFNISKLSLNEQNKISKLIIASGGIIISNEENESEYYLICSTITSSEYETIDLYNNIICVSIIYIYESLIKGKLLNIYKCISYFPQILRNHETNALFDDITICITQFDNKLFERFRIQSLLYDTNANYSKTFHAKRCDLLIANQPKGPKYTAALENNVPIVNFLWLIDSIKNSKQMDFNKYKLISNSETNTPIKPKPKQNTASNNNASNINGYTISTPIPIKLAKKKRKSSVLCDIFDAGLINAVNNTNENNNNDLCSPALASTVPPNNNNNKNKNNNKENAITIDDDTIDLIEIDSINCDNMNPMHDITNYSTQNLRNQYKNNESKTKEPSIEGIGSISPIKMVSNPNQNIVIFCHRSVDKNKQKLIETLINNNICTKAKSLNKNVTHYIIDVELTDKTKEMREVKKRKTNNKIEIVNSKWIYLQLKKINSNNNNNNKYDNSITRARKRKYKDLNFDEFNYCSDGIISDEIDGFDNDFDIINSVKNKHKRKKRKISKNSNGDIRKHITMKNRIGVLLTGVSGNKKNKYVQIVNKLNGVVMDDNNYVDVDHNDEINFKYIVASKLARSEKIIVGIVKKKIIVKPEYLNVCNKKNKWLPYEPYCWMNDSDLIKYIPNNSYSKFESNNEELKEKVELIQAIRKWHSIDIKTTLFYNKNIFIWLPTESSLQTYCRILKSYHANVFSFNNNTLNMNINDINKKLNEYNQNNIQQIYIANQADIKTACKNMCNGNDKIQYQKIRKNMNKNLTFIAKYWKDKNLNCYDSDFILDYSLEGLVFKNSDVTKNDYKFTIN